MITAHPFDLSGGRVQAAIKKVSAAAAYRKVIEANSEAQDLATARGRMLSVAIDITADATSHSRRLLGKPSPT